MNYVRSCACSLSTIYKASLHRALQHSTWVEFITTIQQIWVDIYAFTSSFTQYFFQKTIPKEKSKELFIVVPGPDLVVFSNSKGEFHKHYLNIHFTLIHSLTLFTCLSVFINTSLTIKNVEFLFSSPQHLFLYLLSLLSIQIWLKI